LVLLYEGRIEVGQGTEREMKRERKGWWEKEHKA